MTYVVVRTVEYATSARCRGGQDADMPKDFNLGLVFLSYLVAVTASHVTLLLAARVRDPHATNWKLWVVSGGFAMGIGIWSMHFVATLALKLPIRVLYDLSLTALSWLFAIGACSAAFIILRRLTGKHREFLLPGALIGIGIASMHYTGDASMRLSPGIRYDPVLFVASILIAMGAATAALWIAFHLAKQRAVFTNFGAALVMGAAVVGMHFTAVAAANFHPESICLASGPRLDEEWMAYTIGGFTFVILTATMLLSAYDARLSSAIAGGAEKLRHANEQLELRVLERTRTLASEEARKDAILRTALDCIVSMDARGRIVEWNPAAERTFGYTRQEALGRVLAELVIGLDRYLGTSERQAIGRRIELTGVRRSGEPFPVEVAITVMQEGGEPLFTAYVRDITERKLAEEELRRSHDAARAGSQAKSAFVATMSHEIRTPLNAIIGMLELFSYSKLSIDQREMLSAARESSRSLLMLIDDILDFSKIEVGRLEIHPEPCSVARLVDGVNATFEHLASSKGLASHAAHRSGAVAGAPHRPFATAPDSQQPRQQRDQVHARRHGDPGGEGAGSGRGAPEAVLQRAGFRHRHEPRDPAAPVRAVPAGRIADQPPLRRHRPRARHLAPADRADGRQDPGHQHRRPGHARFGDARRRAGERRSDSRGRARLERARAGCRSPHRPAPSS